LLAAAKTAVKGGIKFIADTSSFQDFSGKPKLSLEQKSMAAEIVGSLQSSCSILSTTPLLCF
jgi:hypothetical protein